MKSRIGRTLFFSLAICLPLAAHAEVPPLTLVKSASPIDLSRSGRRRALEPDLAIVTGDQLVTGADGRASLQFDKMTMTLGADSKLMMVGSEPARAGQPAILILHLERGALRVGSQTGGVAKPELHLGVAELQVQIVGAEVWVEAGGAQRTVCLIKGSVDVKSAVGRQRLDKAGDCAVVDVAGLSVKRPDQALMAARLALTDAPSPPQPRPLPVEMAAAPATESEPLAKKADIVPAPAPAPAPAPEPLPAPASAVPRPAAPLPAAESVVVVPVPSLSPPTPTPPPLPPPLPPPPPPPPPLEPLISATDGPPTGGWTLVAMALAEAESARTQAQDLIEKGLPGIVRLNTLPNGFIIYRVTIGSFASKARAQIYNNQIKERYGLPQLWIAPY